MQKGEVITGEMMSHSQHTLLSVTCMLLMFVITKTACQSFFLITHLHSLRLSMMELIKQLNQDPSGIWNSVELHKQYEDFGIKVLSHRLLFNYLRDTLHPDLLLLCSPGMASIVMFRSKASATFRRS